MKCRTAPTLIISLLLFDKEVNVGGKISKFSSHIYVYLNHIACSYCFFCGRNPEHSELTVLPRLPKPTIVNIELLPVDHFFVEFTLLHHLGIVALLLTNVLLTDILQLSHRLALHPLHYIVYDFLSRTPSRKSSNTVSPEQTIETSC